MSYLHEYKIRNIFSKYWNCSQFYFAQELLQKFCEIYISEFCMYAQRAYFNAQGLIYNLPPPYLPYSSDPSGSLPCIQPPSRCFTNLAALRRVWRITLGRLFKFLFSEFERAFDLSLMLNRRYTSIVRSFMFDIQQHLGRINNESSGSISFSLRPSLSERRWEFLTPSWPVFWHNRSINAVYIARLFIFSFLFFLLLYDMLYCNHKHRPLWCV